MVSNSHSRLIFFSVCFLFLYSCTRDNSPIVSLSGTPSVPIEILVEIGAEDQPMELPYGVITDTLGNIYIADRASLTVKIFDPDGNYIRSIGGRGRGPGEFMQINLMSLANDGTILFQDRGKMEFVYLNTEGEQISSYEIRLSNQYYPKTVKWKDDRTIGLQQQGGSRTSKPLPMNRPLFYIFDRTFQVPDTSFFKFHELGYTENEMFIWSSFVYHPGSFDIHDGHNKFIYSPGVYTGQLYEFIFTEKSGWQLYRSISTTPPNNSSYEIYKTEAEYERMIGIPGVNQIGFSGISDWGRLYSIDTGVFYLDDGRIINFYGEWRGKNRTLQEGNSFDLFVQIIDPGGEMIRHGFIKSLQIDRRPSMRLVNWKDKDDNFYLLNLSETDVPTVIKFRLDIEEI